MPSSLKFRIFSHDGKKEIARFEDVEDVCKILNSPALQENGCLRVKVGPNKRNLIEVWKLSEDNADFLGNSRDFETYINERIADHLAAEEVAIKRENSEGAPGAYRRYRRTLRLRSLRESFPQADKAAQRHALDMDKNREAEIAALIG